MNWVLERRRR